MGTIQFRAAWHKTPERWILRVDVDARAIPRIGCQDYNALQNLPLGGNAQEAHESIREINANRAKLNLPELDPQCLALSTTRRPQQ